MSSPSPSAALAGLNPAQQAAVNYMQGPCLVLAGAGSGKTRVITHKIGRLIQAGLKPEQIAAITFTNKAAAEMRERAKSLIGKSARGVLICTFHALGVRMLRQDGGELGLKPQFSILDSDDVTSIIKDAGGSTDAATARQWQWRISAWKNSGLNAAQAEAQAENDEDRTLARIMARYEERLTAYQSVDFDDLIGLPLKLLQEHAAVRDKWQAALGHVLVDEYQDTNATQYELLKLLVGARGGFTAVGDDDQSIYGWRGATLDNLKRLPVDYPTLKVVKLDCDGEEHEAERVVARIQSLRAGGELQAAGSQHKEWKDFSVLYRANHQAKVFEKAFRRAQIPYKVSGGQSFFDRAEIKDLCSWLRLLSNNDDDPAFMRAVTTPKRGIGHTTLQALGNFASLYKLSLFESLFSHSLGTVLPAKAVGSLQEFGRYLNELEYRAKHTVGAEDARVFLTDWLKDIDYEKHLYDAEDSETVAAGRWSNVMDFCDWMAQRCGGQLEDAVGTTMEKERKSMLEVIQTIALLSTISEREGEQNVVTLSTLHAAKGLEWPHVMLVSCVEGLLPFKLDEENELGTNADSIALRLQEERRLMYVGITRAQRTLAVSWLRRRKKGRDMIAGTVSRFVGEMGLDKTTVREDPHEKIRALRAEFAQRAADGAAAKALAESKANF